MKQVIAAIIATTFAMGSAYAQTPAAGAPHDTAAHAHKKSAKKAKPAKKTAHKKVKHAAPVA